MGKREVGFTEADELIALFDACDAFGRHFIMDAARKQAAQSTVASPPTLVLALPKPSLDHKPDSLDGIVNRRALTLVR